MLSLRTFVPRLVIGIADPNLVRFHYALFVCKQRKMSSNQENIPEQSNAGGGFFSSLFASLFATSGSAAPPELSATARHSGSTAAQTGNGAAPTSNRSVSTLSGEEMYSLGRASDEIEPTPRAQPLVPDLRRTFSAPDSVLYNSNRAPASQQKDNHDFSLLSRATSMLSVPLSGVLHAVRSVGEVPTRDLAHTDAEHFRSQTEHPSAQQSQRNPSIYAEQSPILSGKPARDTLRPKVKAPKLAAHRPAELNVALFAEPGQQQRPHSEPCVAQNPLKRSVGPAHPPMSPKTAMVCDPSTAPHSQTDSDNCNVSLAAGIANLSGAKTHRRAVPPDVARTTSVHTSVPEPAETDNTRRSTRTPTVQPETQHQSSFENGSNLQIAEQRAFIKLQRETAIERERQIAQDVARTERQLQIMEQNASSMAELMKLFQTVQSAPAAAAPTGPSTSDKATTDTVRVKDVHIPKFAGNAQAGSSFVNTEHFLPLLLWFSNAKRVTLAAGLTESQSVRCIAGHLTGAAQRLFFEQFHGVLSDLTLDDLGKRLMDLIPGHEAQFTRDAMSLTFHKHAMFESVRRFSLLWQYSHLDSANGVFIHSTLKDKITAAAPTLLTDAWHHCRLDFHHVEGDDLTSLVKRVVSILTALQAANRLPVQFEKATDKPSAVAEKPDKSNTKAAQLSKKRPREDTGPSSAPAKKKAYHPPDVEKFAKTNKICMRCCKPLNGENPLVHLKSDSCLKNRPDQAEAERRIRALMSAKESASK